MAHKAKQEDWDIRRTEYIYPNVPPTHRSIDIDYTERRARIFELIYYYYEWRDIVAVESSQFTIAIADIVAVTAVTDAVDIYRPDHGACETGIYIYKLSMFEDDRCVIDRSLFFFCPPKWPIENNW
ncbi:hypothetical protein QTP88_012086 [Uroleucon formosanum]